MKLLTGIITVILMLLLASCGQKSGTKLNVSASFAIGGEEFSGGLIAHGIGPNGQKFQLTSGDSKTVSITLPDGQWRIILVGWDNTSGMKFSGTKYCGFKDVNLNSTISDINISVTQANCSNSELTNLLGFHSPIISSCGAFYSYNPATNNYSSISNTTRHDYCKNLPSEMAYSFPAYRLVYNDMINVDNGVPSVLSGVASECKVPNTLNPIFTDLPTRLFPMTVKFYRSLKDCQSPMGPYSVNFDFPNGLEAGNNSSFSRTYIELPDNQRRVVFPSTFTRRGNSNLMGLVPRPLKTVNTVNADLFEDFKAPEISAKKVDVRVEYNTGPGGEREIPIIKGAFPLTGDEEEEDCSPTLRNFLAPSSASSPAFYIFQTENGNPKCKIKNGNILASFKNDSCTSGSTISCNQDIKEISLASLGFPGKNLVIGTKSANSGDQYYLMNNLLQYVGRRTLSDTHAHTYFTAVSDDEDDGIRTGGILTQAQEMLGPDGIGGVLFDLYPDKDCLEIANEVKTSGRVVSKSFSELFQNMTRTYSLELKKITESIPTGLVDGTTQPKFDLQLFISGEDEKILVKLNCTKKIGYIENLENRNGETRRELLLWNFDTLPYKFERYNLETGYEQRAEVTTFSQTTAAGDFSLRSVQIEDPYYSSYPEGSVKAHITQLQSQLQSSTLKVERFSQTINTVPDWDEDLYSAQINGSASDCMNATNQVVFSSQASGCSGVAVDFTGKTWIADNSSKFNLSSVNSFFNETPGQVPEVFTLSP